MVGKVLGEAYNSHTQLENLFREAGAPGDPPGNNCVTKCQLWLQRASDDASVDGLEVLGTVLVSFMEVDSGFNRKTKEGRQRVERILSQSGLSYHHGRIVAGRGEPSRFTTDNQGMKGHSMRREEAAGGSSLDGASTEIQVFISHSSKDEPVAKRLITLMRSALNLPSDAIRCTSVAGFQLPAGASTDTALKQEIYASRVLIGLITPSSIKSPYVLFELGARWGAQKAMLPLLARGATTADLKGPLSAIMALNCNNTAQLHQFLENLAENLGMSLDRPAAYQKCIDELLVEQAPRKDMGAALFDQA